MRSTAFDKERDTALRLMDLLGKLADEDDAYDATAVVVEWKDPASGAAVADEIGGKEDVALYVAVSIRHELIPENLRPDRFLTAMVSAVRDRTPVNLHRKARERYDQEVPEEKGVTGALNAEGEEG